MNELQVSLCDLSANLESIDVHRNASTRITFHQKLILQVPVCLERVWARSLAVACAASELLTVQTNYSWPVEGVKTREESPSCIGYDRMI